MKVGKHCTLSIMLLVIMILSIMTPILIVNSTASIVQPVNGIDLGNLLKNNTLILILNLDPNKTYCINGYLKLTGINLLIINGNGARIYLQNQGGKPFDLTIIGPHKIVFENVRFVLNDLVTKTSKINIVDANEIILNNIELTSYHEPENLIVAVKECKNVFLNGIYVENKTSLTIKGSASVLAASDLIENNGSIIDLSFESTTNFLLKQSNIDQVTLQYSTDIINIKDSRIGGLIIYRCAFVNINITNSGFKSIYINTANINSRLNLMNLDTDYLILAHLYISMDNVTAKVTTITQCISSLIDKLKTIELYVNQSLLYINNSLIDVLRAIDTGYIVINNSILGHPLYSSIFLSEDLPYTHLYSDNLTVMIINSHIYLNSTLAPELFYIEHWRTHVELAVINTTITSVSKNPYILVKIMNNNPNFKYSRSPVSVVFAGDNIIHVKTLGISNDSLAKIYFYGNNIAFANKGYFCHGYIYMSLVYNNISLPVNYILPHEYVYSEITRPIVRCWLNNIYYEGMPSTTYLHTVNENVYIIPDTSQQVKYLYNGTIYNGFLGNHYSWVTGTDKDGNGIIDRPVTGLAVDRAPLYNNIEKYTIVDGLVLVWPKYLIQKFPSLDLFKPEQILVIINGVKKVDNKVISCCKDNLGKITVFTARPNDKGIIYISYQSLDNKTHYIITRLNIEAITPVISLEFLNISVDKSYQNISIHIKYEVQSSQPIESTMIFVILNSTHLAKTIFTYNYGYTYDFNLVFKSKLPDYDKKYNVKIIIMASDVMFNYVKRIYSYQLELPKRNNNNTTKETAWPISSNASSRDNNEVTSTNIITNPNVNSALNSKTVTTTTPVPSKSGFIHVKFEFSITYEQLIIILAVIIFSVPLLIMVLRMIRSGKKAS